MSLLVKICGLNTEETLDAALAEGADMVGFVFFAPSPRHIAFERAVALGAHVRGRAIKVALSVNASDDELAAAVAALRPDVLQLHGDEPPARVAEVKARFGRPVMKAIAIETRADLDAMTRYRGIADRLLFDARAPREATRPGGLGRAFDWDILRDIDPSVDYLLSGGLDAQNVAQALRATRAPGVDVSSGVERRPGDKDPSKIADFIRAARQADAARTDRAVSPA